MIQNETDIGHLVLYLSQQATYLCKNLIKRSVKEGFFFFFCSSLWDKQLLYGLARNIRSPMMQELRERENKEISPLVRGFLQLAGCPRLEEGRERTASPFKTDNLIHFKNTWAWRLAMDI